MKLQCQGSPGRCTDRSDLDRAELCCSAPSDSEARQDLPTPLHHSSGSDPRAIASHQDNAGSLLSGSLCETEEGVLALGIKMISAGLGTGKKWDRVSLKAVVERGEDEERVCGSTLLLGGTGHRGRPGLPQPWGD